MWSHPVRTQFLVWPTEEAEASLAAIVDEVRGSQGEAAEQALTLGTSKKEPAAQQVVSLARKNVQPTPKSFHPNIYNTC